MPTIVYTTTLLLFESRFDATTYIVCVLSFRNDSYDQVNRPRAHWTIAADVVAKGSTMPKKRLVPLLREVRTMQLSNMSVCGVAFLKFSCDRARLPPTAVCVHMYGTTVITEPGTGIVLLSRSAGRGWYLCIYIRLVSSFCPKEQLQVHSLKVSVWL